MPTDTGDCARERAERAARSLSPLERRVLELSAAHGLGNDEIALRLRIGRRRAERLLARAIRKFDGALQRERFQ